ncbi:hypothetical protein GOV11_01290 [Candidatus Woesearchaeota archaeon]|nr:hypothetical protein [Candidatus Woesearchaeota archaeon]
MVWVYTIDECNFDSAHAMRDGIREADEIHVEWNRENEHTLVGCGMAFGDFKPIRLANRSFVPKIEGKDFNNVMLTLDDMARGGERRNRPEIDEDLTFFLICSVREADKALKKYLDDYVDRAQIFGNKVHYPARHTNQDDPIGYNICSQNLNAILRSSEIHQHYAPISTGSKFDVGMSFVNCKRLYVINRDDVRGREFYPSIVRSMALSYPETL